MGMGECDWGYCCGRSFDMIRACNNGNRDDGFVRIMQGVGEFCTKGK